MPFSITKNDVQEFGDGNSFEYQTYGKENAQAEAKKQLFKLNEWISASSGELKPGALRFIKTSDGSYQLKRRRFYQFWNFSGTRDTSRATQYINSLIKAAKEPEETSTYITPSKEKTGTADLKKKIESLFPRGGRVHVDVQTRKTEGVEKSELSKKSIPIDLSGNQSSAVEKNPFNGFLSSCGVTLGKKIGEGACGVVMEASIVRDDGKYVFKEENRPFMIPIAQAGELPFHQRGDLAASCVKALKHMTKPIFVIVALQKKREAPLEYHYVSAMEAESFVEEVAKKFPNASAGVVGQLMELAQGQELLDSIVGTDKIEVVDFAPSGRPFKQIMNTLCEHLESAILNNYLHGDIKLKNIIHNTETGAIRLIDGGFAALGNGKIKKLNEQGTPTYVSPRIVTARDRNSFYGAEVDAYSVAMVLLASIDSSSFVRAHDEKTNRVKFFTDLTKRCGEPGIEAKYLQAYFLAAAHGDRNLLQEITVFKELAKPENAAVKNLIDLSFQVSAGGKEGEAAFTKWQDAFHAWQKEEGF